MSRAVLLSVAVLALGFAPLPFLAPNPKALANADLKALQGEWDLATASIDGEELSFDDSGDFVFRGRLLGKVGDQREVALDASRSHRRMIAQHGKESEDRMVFLYRVHDDTLTVCYWAGIEVCRTCPPDLKPRKGVCVLTFRRKKP